MELARWNSNLSPCGTSEAVSRLLGQKKRILALAAHYHLQNRSDASSLHSSILLLMHFSNIFMKDVLLLLQRHYNFVCRVRNEERLKDDEPLLRRSYSEDFEWKCPTKERPYLIITTCHGANQLRRRISELYIVY